MSTVVMGNGDELDVEAGRCCPHCRNDLTPHNKAVYDAAWSMYQRHEFGGDRHPKWVRVEPGTVIPAGQPYRTEYPDGSVYELNRPDAQYSAAAVAGGIYFVDSSWKPPLDLPTEPTWGIAVLNGPEFVVGRWQKSLSIPGTLCKRIGDGNFAEHSWPLDFIPLTDEQVQRIEKAR